MSATLKNGVRVPDSGSVNWDADVNSNWSLLDGALGALSKKITKEELATVATSGSYNDLSDKPDLPDTTSFYTKTETDELLASKTNDSDLSAVAKSGSYTDLINTPDIPDTSNFYTKAQTDELLISKANSSEVYTKTEVDNLISGGATVFHGNLVGNADTATKATNNASGNELSNDIIKGLSVSGKVITYTKLDGSTGTITTQDTNTDTKVTNTLGNTTKAYITGTTSASTNTGTQIFDSGVYLTTTAGQLHADIDFPITEAQVNEILGIS